MAPEPIYDKLSLLVALNEWPRWGVAKVSTVGASRHLYLRCYACRPDDEMLWRFLRAGLLITPDSGLQCRECNRYG